MRMGTFPCNDSDDTALTYFCGVRVPPGPIAPADLVAIEVPALRYAGFAHEGPVETLSGTIVAALRNWLPAAGPFIHRAPGRAGPRRT